MPMFTTEELLNALNELIEAQANLPVIYDSQRAGIKQSGLPESSVQVLLKFCDEEETMLLNKFQERINFLQANRDILGY